MPDNNGKANEQRLLSVPEEHVLIEAPAEERLKREIDALRREVEQLRERDKKKHSEKAERPRTRTLWLIGAALLAVLVIAFFVGWLPHHNREKKLQKEAQEEANALPQVNYVLAQSSAPVEQLM